MAKSFFIFKWSTNRNFFCGGKFKIFYHKECHSSKKFIRACSNSTKTCHYDVLGIKKEATKTDIRDAFLQKSKQFHPDLNPNDESLHEKFVQVSEAYNILSDPSKRVTYDSTKSNAYNQHQRYPDGTASNPFGGYHEPEWEIDYETRQRMYAQFYSKTYPEYQKKMADEYANRSGKNKKILGFALLFTLVFALFNFLRIQRHHIVYQKAMEETTAVNAALLSEGNKGYGAYLKRASQEKSSSEE